MSNPTLLNKLNEVRFQFYRAKVINNVDTTKTGRVQVYIPDTMHDAPESQGLWAYPANCPYGGGNTSMSGGSANAGSLMVPTVGQWVWVFFENNNPHKPFYLGALYINNKPALAETSQGGQWWNKWVLFRSPDGRSMWISDDPSDARVMMTGAKKDTSSSGVFNIQGNQNVILIDEVGNRILVADQDADYFLIDTAGNHMYLRALNTIQIYTQTTLISCNTSGDINIQVPNATIQINNGVVNITASQQISIKSSSSITLDAPSISMNGGASQSASNVSIPNISVAK